MVSGSHSSAVHVPSLPTMSPQADVLSLHSNCSNRAVCHPPLSSASPSSTPGTASVASTSCYTPLHYSRTKLPSAWTKSFIWALRHLFQLDENARQVFGVQKRHRVVMRSHLWLLVQHTHRLSCHSDGLLAPHRRIAKVREPQRAGSTGKTVVDVITAT